MLDLPPLTSENEEKCSEGETRTHNLADDPDEDPEQHQLEQSQPDRRLFIQLLTANDRTFRCFERGSRAKFYSSKPSLDQTRRVKWRR